MTRIILQPCGNKDSRAHYADTIESPVELERVAEFLDAGTVDSLRSSVSEGTVATWGVTPGKSGGNVAKWERVDSGDIALFSREGQIFSAATVVMKIHNERLAEALWGRDSNDQTWEYIYFLAEVRPLSVSYADFNAAAEYDENYVIQGFNVLDPDRSRVILDRFDLESEAYLPSVSEKEFTDAVTSAPSGPLDVYTSTQVRTEQKFLRRHLFKNQVHARCCFCGDLLPVEFLVAAHIKRRSDCSDQEKLDYRNVVMPMCKLGCDELFERGYLGVRAGIITELLTGPTTDRLKALISKLVGSSCSAWSANSEKYFDAHWHRFQGQGDP